MKRIIFDNSRMVSLAFSGSMSTSAWMLFSVFMKKCGLIWYFRYSSCCSRFFFCRDSSFFWSLRFLKKSLMPIFMPNISTRMTTATMSCWPMNTAGT